jgi:2-hydroxychromene-2-carboxylate isomerase
MMHKEWAEGQDIGDTDVILQVGESVGLDPVDLRDAIDSTENFSQMERNWEEAQEIGVIGVPSFVINEEIFWGSDRIEYLEDHVRELRLARL